MEIIVANNVHKTLGSNNKDSFLLNKLASIIERSIVTKENKVVK